MTNAKEQLRNTEPNRALGVIVALALAVIVAVRAGKISETGKPGAVDFAVTSAYIVIFLAAWRIVMLRLDNDNAAKGAMATLV